MNNIAAVLVVGALAVGAFYVGANYQESDGPAQELGAKIDETINDAAREVEDATD